MEKLKIVIIPQTLITIEPYHIAGFQGAKEFINVLLLKFLPHSEKHGTPLH